MIIVAKLDYSPVLSAMRRAANVMQNTSPLMGNIAGIMHAAVMVNFQEQGRPAWKALAPSTQLSKAMGGQWKNLAKGGKVQPRSAGMILGDTGILKGSVQMSSSNMQAVVGSNLVYAAIHQFGGKTKPHVIRPKFKRALSFGGIVVRQVNHPGSNIPARPFLKLAPRDMRAIVLASQRHYNKALAANGLLS